MSPLSNLTRAGADLKWTPKHDEIVQRVLNHLSEEACLALPNSSGSFVLEVE